jgi:hypothetical protein
MLWFEYSLSLPKLILKCDCHGGGAGRRDLQEVIRLLRGIVQFLWD